MNIGTDYFDSFDGIVPIRFHTYFLICFYITFHVLVGSTRKALNMAVSMLLCSPCVTKIKSATDPAKQRFSSPSELNYSFASVIHCNSLSDSSSLVSRKLIHKLKPLFSKQAVVTSF